MAPNPPPKPALLARLRDYVATTTDIEYGALGKHAADNGWTWQLRQTGIAPAANGFAVSFDLLVGHKDDGGRMDALDSLTIVSPPHGSPSIIARLAATPTILFVVFGRVPPVMASQIAQLEHSAGSFPTAVPATQPTRPNGADRPAPAQQVERHEVFMEDETGNDVVLSVPVKVVKRRTPSGAPVFIDLFEDIPETIPSDVVVRSVLDEMQQFLLSAPTVESVTEAYTENPVLKEFLDEFGTETDRKRLSRMLTTRKEELEPPIPARRRRAAA